METRLIGSLTEIYIGGGNSWLTESYPTNFHTFCRRKVLTAKDSPDNYKEVTDAEKTALEKADAEWERPGQEFIDKWNMGANGYGQYNEGTGYFELYDLMDIPYQEALAIYETHNGGVRQDIKNIAAQPIRTNRVYHCRALLPFMTWINTAFEANALIAYNTRIEVICFHSDRDYDYVSVNGIPANNATALRKIVGNPVVFSANNPFPSCNKLEYVRIVLQYNLMLADCRLLNLESLTYMAEHPKNTSPISVTLHPEAFARLTDELIAKAAEKQITFVTTE